MEQKLLLQKKTKSAYRRRQRFFHKKSCKIEIIIDNITNNEVKNESKKTDEQIDSKTDKELKDLVKDLIKQNGELVKTIQDIVPKIGTTNNITNNNHFNLNVFLN